MRVMVHFDSDAADLGFFLGTNRSVSSVVISDRSTTEHTEKHGGRFTAFRRSETAMDLSDLGRVPGGVFV